MHTIADESLGFIDTGFAKKTRKDYVEKVNKSQFITGFQQKIIRLLIRLNIIWIACRKFKNPLLVFRQLKKLHTLKTNLRNGGALNKYAFNGRRYFLNYVIPGWPSLAFNRFIDHQFNRLSSSPPASLGTLIFALTKKCGFKCVHCCEWNNLNKPEVLGSKDLQTIIEKFHELGIAQVQLSGGEPLNRLNEILHLLKIAPKGIDFWMYSTGYSLTPEKAGLLKSAGLTGITLSLDHFKEDEHDRFRGVKGSFNKTVQAAQFARDAGLMVCFSICTTREFVTEDNLTHYTNLAKDLGAAFIQFLEPKAVGHFAGQDVLLQKSHKKILEDFFLSHNYNSGHPSHPIISYHGFITANFGCSGSGRDYVYVDTDGDVHNCPFCQRKLFSVFEENLKENILRMKKSGCQLVSNISAKN